MYQKTIIVGHVGKDAELRYTPQGVAVTSFNVATSRKWTDANGQKQEHTTWFRVTCWRKLAEVCAQYVTKGRCVQVEGTIEASAYTGKDGQARASLELTADHVLFLPGKGSDDGNGSYSTRPQAVHREPDLQDELDQEVSF